MDIFEAISSRRSIRKYTGEPVGDDKIWKILTAAMMAPSAGNEQPWQFLVLREKATLRAISQSHPYADMVEHADVAILVCADMKLVKHKDYWSQDCAAATQNMLLAAHALGLGAVWVGVYPRERRLEEIRAIIRMPDQIIPFSLVPVGHPAEKKSAEHRFDESRIHRESWR